MVEIGVQIAALGKTGTPGTFGSFVQLCLILKFTL